MQFLMNSKRLSGIILLMRLMQSCGLLDFYLGLKAKIIPLLKQIQEPQTIMIDEFVTDIREFSTSVSGCNSPAAIIMMSGSCYETIKDAIEKLDYAMSPETVVVGDNLISVSLYQ